MKFTLDGSADEVVFTAQGVGITPFRSLLRHIAHHDFPKQQIKRDIFRGY